MIVANLVEFYARSALDWENFTPTMTKTVAEGCSLGPDDRWEPRHRDACIFCARCHWREELTEEFLVGVGSFLKDQKKVFAMLSCDRYANRFALIPSVLACGKCKRALGYGNLIHG